jgi:hypothetical protein
MTAIAIDDSGKLEIPLRNPSTTRHHHSPIPQS